MAEATARVFDSQMVKEVEALKGQPRAYWGIVLWETSLEVLVPILKNSIRTFRWTNSNNHNFNSTSDNDNRITKIGKIIRKIKLDEITQLINVLIGNLSLVGPRPNVFEDVNKYTDKEKHILSVLPGITDFSSIVFSDEGSILKNSKNPDLDYDILIRPWKSRLALLYINNSNLVLDIKILFFTFTNFFMRNRTLSMINTQLIKLK